MRLQIAFLFPELSKEEEKGLLEKRLKQLEQQHPENSNSNIPKSSEQTWCLALTLEEPQHTPLGCGELNTKHRINVGHPRSLNSSKGRHRLFHNPGLLCISPPSAKTVVAVM
jgi:hypothetical protein